MEVATGISRGKTKPTSASQLNLVAFWFGIFQRKVLRNASFVSIDHLAGAIQDFTAAYNENA